MLRPLQCKTVAPWRLYIGLELSGQEACTLDAVNNLLDKVKETCSLESDKELAEKLGVVKSAVSNWRNGRAKPDVVAAAEIAKLTHMKLGAVIGMIEEARALSPAAKAIWRKLATAAGILLAVYTTTYPQTASAKIFGHNADKLYIAHIAHIRCGWQDETNSRNQAHLSPSSTVFDANRCRTTI